MNNVVYVTGNPEKAKHFSQHIGLAIDHIPAELDEIQTLSAPELVEHKIRQAFDQIGRPVLVEDVTFCVDAWGGLPGPFIKYYVNAVDGTENLIKMTDGFDNRRARAACTFGYFDGSRLELFTGGIDGMVARNGRGTNGYGFDRIFEPDGFDGMTAGELTDEQYQDYYAQIKPFDKVRKFLQELTQ